MNITDLENSLQSILKPELGVSRFVPTQQNMPEQVLSYASYDLLTINHIGRVSRGEVDANGDRPFYEHYEMVFRIIAYGSGAMNILQDLSKALCKETITTALFEANLAYSTKTTVRRLPEVVSSRWEERAQIIVTFFTVDEDSENIGFVDNATFENTFTGSGGDIVQTIDINR